MCLSPPISNRTDTLWPYTRLFQAFGDLAYAVVDMDLGDVDLGGHLLDGEPVCLEGAYRLAEGLSGLGILHRLPERTARPGDCGDRDGEALGGQVLHEVEEPAALLAEQVGCGHAAVGEEELCGVLGVVAHLLQLAAPLEPGGVTLDGDQAEALVSGFRVGAEAHDHDVAEDAFGDR